MVIKSMLDIAKWQQEQDKNKYSEEDMKDYALKCVTTYLFTGDFISDNLRIPIVENNNKQFEQFKKNNMENPNNLSAVEFLHSEYKRIFFYESITPQQSIELSNVIEKAKEMFEQQIIDATLYGFRVDAEAFDWNGDKYNAEQYYNEKFKNK
jgi:hypothetical protein